MGRFPWIAATNAYARAIRTTIDATTMRERERKLRYVGQALHDAKDSGQIDTTDPFRLGKREIDYLTDWMRARGFGLAYQVKLWQYVRGLLKYVGNGALDRLEARGEWKRPTVPRTVPKIVEEAWVKDALQRLESVDTWRGTICRFAVSFYIGTGLRPKELRLANLRDLDTSRWSFRIMHPKGEHTYGLVGAEIDIYADTQIPVLDFLAAREKRVRELGLDPKKVAPLVPNENGDHYSLCGWNNVRYQTFRQVGIEGDFRTLRRTHGQMLCDRLEAKGYKDGAIIEIGSKRLRNTMTTFQRSYADLRTNRARNVARDAWESVGVQTPLIERET